MSETKHTPGPWTYLEDHDGDAAGGPLTIHDSANNDLANIYSRDDATVDIPREQAIANARLIAAAPDLLAAAMLLEKAEEDHSACVVCEGSETWWDCVSCRPAFHTARAKRRSAIAAAKGGAQ